MDAGFLWGYAPGDAITEEAAWVYGASLPLLVEFLADEFIPTHVTKHRRDAAMHDLQTRLEELFDEAKLCRATAVPLAVGPWYVAKRKHAFKKGAPDLRARRARLSDQEQPLFAQYEDLRWRLKRLLPRRTDHAPISAEEFRGLKRSYPQVRWKSRAESIDQTPSTVARLILSERLGLSPKGVQKAVRLSRKDWREKGPPSWK